MLNDENYEIKVSKRKIVLISKIDGFLIIDSTFFQQQLENKAILKILKENFLRKNEKFLEIELKNEDNFLKLKIINMLLNTDFIKLFEIKEFTISIILVKEEIDFDKKMPIDFFEFFKKYKIFLDEINLTIPEESEILSSIDELIIKSDFILILFEENLREKLKKYFKDFGNIIKDDELTLIKRKNKKIFVLTIERLMDLMNNILKEVYS